MQKSLSHQSAFYSVPFPCGAFLRSAALRTYIIYHTTMYYYASIFASQYISALHRIITSDRAVTIPYKHKDNRYKPKRPMQRSRGEKHKTGGNKRRRKDSAHQKSVICFRRSPRIGAGVACRSNRQQLQRNGAKRRSTRYILHIISIICDFFRASGVFFEVLDSGSAWAPGSTSIGTFDFYFRL